MSMTELALVGAGWSAWSSTIVGEAWAPLLQLLWPTPPPQAIILPPASLLWYILLGSP